MTDDAGQARSPVNRMWLLSLLIKDASGRKTPLSAWLAFLSITGIVAFLMTAAAAGTRLPKNTRNVRPTPDHYAAAEHSRWVAINLVENFGTRLTGGIVSVGPTTECLYIAAPAMVRWLFPTIQLPWSAIASAKPFEAPGWVQPIAEPGAVFQAQYDFGYTGQFLELETTEPWTCIRLPVYAIEDALGKLPRSLPISPP